MSKGSAGRRLSRGDRRRNERLSGLRAVVTRQCAVVAFDLADAKQVCVVTDPDSRVLARRTFQVKAWQLGDAVAWGVARAREAGFTDVVVACEPTGHRWRVLDQITAACGVRLVCVQPMLVHRAREGEDFTRNKNDDADAVVIARLVTELRCYLPERADPVWARLRHLGARRAGLVTQACAARQQVQALLECAWPAALDAAAEPLESKSWAAAMVVVLDRVGHGGDLRVIRAWGWKRFAAAVRRELPNHGATRWCQRIVQGVFQAATDPQLSGMGVLGQRPGALERIRYALADLAHARTATAQVEAGIAAVIEELQLTELVTSIPGVSVITAGMILAQTGDPSRFATARALVKHAGLCPRDNSSGTFTGRAAISGRGRPELRLAAWRATSAALRTNPVLAARYQQLTTRTHNKLTPTQARVAVTAALLRQLHAVTTSKKAWDPDIASGRTRTTETQEDTNQAA